MRDAGRATSRRGPPSSPGTVHSDHVETAPRTARRGFRSSSIRSLARELRGTLGQEGGDAFAIVIGVEECEARLQLRLRVRKAAIDEAADLRLVLARRHRRAGDDRAHGRLDDARVIIAW